MISELYYPEETSTGHVLTKIAEGLVDRYAVYALCSQPTYSSRGRRAPARETRNGVDIERVWGLTLNKDVLWQRLLNAVTFSTSIFVRALRRLKRGDVVLVVTTPPFLPFVMVTACKIRGAACVLIVHDVYPDVLIAAGMARSNAWSVRVVRAVTGWLYRTVDRVVVLGRDMETLVARKLDSNHSGKLVVIPNWGDVDTVKPAPKDASPTAQKLGLLNRFVVQYAGNMGRTHGMEDVMEAARRLRCENVHWMMLGSGAKRRWVEAYVEREGLRNVTVDSIRSREDQQDFLNACDVSIISFAPGMAGVSVPSRMYNSMAAGKPIIAVADAESELARVVTEEAIGVVVPPGDVAQLVATIQRLAADPITLHEMGTRARAVVIEKYSLPHTISTYARLIDNMLDQRN
jgi:glycosyltransferase involved in cell wall biosynthesis